MENRYTISNGRKFAQFPFNRIGLMQIRAFRSARPEFKRRHIRSVIQALPQDVKFGVEYFLL